MFNAARHRLLQAHYTRLAAAFFDSTEYPYVPDRPTIVFLPGGMGSELSRTTLPWNEADPDDPRPTKLWGDLDALCKGSALDLGINSDGEDACGSLVYPAEAFLMQPVVPYAGVRDFLRLRPGKPKYNFVVFPYDWRRWIDDSAGWLAFFLAALRDLATERGLPDPLNGVTILCHSQGGLVGKCFLNSVSTGWAIGLPLNSWNGKLITVGTPFYGTDTIIRHFFLPMPELASVGAYKQPTRLPSVVSSMTGPYILLFADRATLSPTVLGQLGLDPGVYPMRDERDEPIDPYDPHIREHRYPTWITRPQPGNSADFSGLIDAAASLRAEVVQPLPSPLAESIFHLRGVTNKDTGVGMTWRDPGPDGFVPGQDPEPFVKIPDLKRPASSRTLFGDGLVPFWSSRLSWIPDARVYDLQRAASHLSLVGHRETLEVIGTILDTGALPAVSKKLAVSNEIVRAKGSKKSGLPSAWESAARRSLRSSGSSGLSSAELERASSELWAELLARNGLT